MEGNDFYSFSLMATQAHKMILVMMVIVEPYIRGLRAAAVPMFTASCLFYVAWAIGKSMFDRFEGFAVAVLLMCLIGFGLVERTLDVKSTISGKELSGTLKVPNVIYYPYKGFSSISEMIQSSINKSKQYVNEKGRGYAGVGLATSSAIIANNELMKGEDYKPVRDAYTEYANQCNDFLSGVANDKKLTTEEAYALGLMGGNGIFINDTLLTESARDDSFHTTGLKALYDHLLNRGDGLVSDLETKTKLANYDPIVESAEDSFRVLVEGDGSPLNNFDKFTMNVYKEGESTPMPESMVPDVTWINSDTAASYKNNLLSIGLNEADANAMLAEEAKNHEGYFYPDNCYEMYELTRAGIKSWQDSMDLGIKDAAMTGGLSSGEPGTVVATYMSSMYVLKAHTTNKDGNGYDQQSMTTDIDTRDKGFFEKLKAKITNPFENFVQKSVTGLDVASRIKTTFDMQFIIPGIIVGISAMIVFAFMLSPLIFSIAPVTGFGVIATLLKVIATLFLALLIFQLVFIAGASIIDEVHMMSSAALIGPGGKAVSIMMLQSQITMVMLAAASTLVVTVAYMIIMNDTMSLKSTSFNSTTSSELMKTAGTMLAAAKLMSMGKSAPGVADSGGGDSGGDGALEGQHMHTPMNSMQGAVGNIERQGDIIEGDFSRDDGPNYGGPSPSPSRSLPKSQPKLPSK